MKSFLTTTNRTVKLMIEVHRRVYDSADFNFEKEIEDLFKHSFKVKYLISTKKNPKAIIDLGYEALRHGTETETTRSLFENIKPSDFLAFLKEGLVRSVMLEKA